MVILSGYHLIVISLYILCKSIVNNNGFSPKNSPVLRPEQVIGQQVVLRNCFMKLRMVIEFTLVSCMKIARYD